MMVDPRGGFRPRATRAMARGSAQNFFFQLFRTGPAQHRGGGFYLTVRPCPSPVRPNPDAASPARQYATTRIRPNPQPLAATRQRRPATPRDGRRRRQRPPSALRSGLRRQAQGAGGQALRGSASGPPSPWQVAAAGARRQPAARQAVGPGPPAAPPSPCLLSGTAAACTAPSPSLRPRL